MEMIRLNITILVIIFIYFLHVLSSRSVMENKATGTWGRRKKKDSISDEESHLTFLQQHSLRGERKCQHLPPTERQTAIVDDPKLADTAARPCEVNASLGKGAGRSREQRGGPAGSHLEGPGRRTEARQPMGGLRRRAPPPPRSAAAPPPARVRPPRPPSLAPGAARASASESVPGCLPWGPVPAGGGAGSQEPAAPASRRHAGCAHAQQLRPPAHVTVSGGSRAGVLGSSAARLYCTSGIDRTTIVDVLD